MVSLEHLTDCKGAEGTARPPARPRAEEVRLDKHSGDRLARAWRTSQWKVGTSEAQHAEFSAGKWHLKKAVQQGVAVHASNPSTGETQPEDGVFKASLASTQ